MKIRNKFKKKINPFFRLFGIVIALILITIIIIIGAFFYYFSFPDQGGLSPTSYPDGFTRSISSWIVEENGTISLKKFGMKWFDEQDMWLQVLDEKGQEVYSYNKPDSYPVSYSASELMALKTSEFDNDYTVFTSDYEGLNQTYGYIVGYPYNIGKHLVYTNGERIGLLTPAFRNGVRIVFVVFIIFAFVYGFWLSKNLGKITEGIQNISKRNYTPLSGKGFFREVFDELNEMNDEIRRSDELKKETERVRKEWITNITHDIKTPLSPIKGYAELLVDNQIPENSSVQEYGKIILKNADYAEKLINDLKLTYQFETGVIPLNMKETHLVSYVRELVIDIINDPAFSTRDIEFEGLDEDIVVSIDEALFRRALGNLIINALTHNTIDTKVCIGIERYSREIVSIFVRDNGKGMSDEEQAEIFERYYRGTSTKEKPEGSGLGLAIAKQIVSHHEGEITVKSRVGEGTEFRVSIPINKEIK